MDASLVSLSKIFHERLFRIPDFQRGYAWSEKQIADFWYDIEQLDLSKKHYANVFTLEEVPESIYKMWVDDQWIIESKSYKPYFVIDGQQRLTTSLILIQCIIEVSEKNKWSEINFTSIEDIRKKFLFEKRTGGVSRSYIFGYEKDNPSYNFLKNRIFGERIEDNVEHTVYTRNLEFAKEYFSEKFDKMSFGEVEVFFKKLTQNLIFNILSISSDVDVCVAFEAMNNRGKVLSYLELLKNRLIYLAINFDDEVHEKNKLRIAINSCWKDIYHNLGRNKDNPLDDDSFLLSHSLVYFGEIEEIVDNDGNVKVIRTGPGLGYAKEILEKRFILKNIREPFGSDEKIVLSDLYKYVGSLQDSVKEWYIIFNPNNSDYNSEINSYLEKLNRLGFDTCHALVLSFMSNVKDETKKLAFLQSLERFLFLTVIAGVNVIRSNSRDLKRRAAFLDLAIKLSKDINQADTVIKHIRDASNEFVRKDFFIATVVDAFKTNNFYSWFGIRYFMYEYELSLKNKSKSARFKLNWEDFSRESEDYLTVEHIYPRQARHKYWTSRFADYSQKQKEALRNSLGNLLPLSRGKNAALSNKPFPEKARISEISYRIGSYSEIEISDENEWGASEILNRGLSLIKFMEKRWGFDLESDGIRKEILGLEFMP